jgi:hypothetical protein
MRSIPAGASGSQWQQMAGFSKDFAAKPPRQSARRTNSFGDGIAEIVWQNLLEYNGLRRPIPPASSPLQPNVGLLERCPEYHVNDLLLPRSGAVGIFVASVNQGKSVISRRIRMHGAFNPHPRPILGASGNEWGVCLPRHLRRCRRWFRRCARYLRRCRPTRHLSKSLLPLDLFEDIESNPKIRCASICVDTFEMRQNRKVTLKFGGRRTLAVDKSWVVGIELPQPAGPAARASELGASPFGRGLQPLGAVIRF